MAEQLIIAAIVLTAVYFVGRRAWRAIAAARSPKGAGCDSGCGCSPAGSQPSRDTVKH